MSELHMYRSVILKKSELTKAKLDAILKATTDDIDIHDPNIYIMVRVEENITHDSYINGQTPIFTIVNNVKYATGSSKGNPPGTNQLP